MSITIRRLTLLLLLLLLPAMSSCAGTEKLPAAEGPAAGDEVPVIPDIDSGVYAEDTALSLSNEYGLPIRYTVDGAIPGPGSALYSEPLILAELPENTALTDHAGEMFIGDRSMICPSSGTVKARVIRAAAEMPDGTMGPVMTGTYFLNDGLWERYGCPVVSIVTDPSDLYDYETGILVRGKVFDDNGAVVPEHIWDAGTANFTQRGKAWERVSYIQVFDGGDTVSVEAPCGIRLKGNYSTVFPQRSINVYLRKDYGQKSIQYGLIPGNADAEGKEIAVYRSFTFRNGGNDTQSMKFKDVLIQELLSGLDFCTQASRPAIVYLNGEYYGIYNLTEKYSDHYIETHYGVDSDNVVVIKEGEVDEGEDGDLELWQSLMTFAYEKSLDLSEETNWEAFLKAVDIRSMVDYYASEIYIANTDWDEYHNYSLWRTRTDDGTPYGDCRWRWMMCDTEYSSGMYQSQPDRDVYYSIRSTAPDYDTLSDALEKNMLFRNAMKNPEFRRMFAERMHALAEDTLAPARVAGMLDAGDREWSRWYPDYMQRFPVSGEETPEQALQNVKAFFDARASYILPIVDGYCNYTPGA